MWLEGLGRQGGSGTSSGGPAAVGRLGSKSAPLPRVGGWSAVGGDGWAVGPSSGGSLVPSRVSCVKKGWGIEWEILGSASHPRTSSGVDYPRPHLPPQPAEDVPPPEGEEVRRDAVPHNLCGRGVTVTGNHRGTPHHHHLLHLPARYATHICYTYIPSPHTSVHTRISTCLVDPFDPDATGSNPMHKRPWRI